MAGFDAFGFYTPGERPRDARGQEGGSRDAPLAPWRPHKPQLQKSIDGDQVRTTRKEIRTAAGASVAVTASRPPSAMTREEALAIAEEVTEATREAALRHAAQ